MSQLKNDNKSEIIKHQNSHNLNQEKVFEEMVRLEEKRIELGFLQQENNKIYLQHFDESNKRLHEFQMQKLKDEKETEKNKYNLFKVSLYFAFFIISVTLIFLIVLIYTGNEFGIKAAITIFVGLAGHGIITSIKRFFNKFNN